MIRFGQPWSRGFRKVVDSSSARPRAAAAHTGAWLPPADIQEQDNQFLLQVDLPGVDPATVEITSKEGVLEIAIPKLARERPRRIVVEAA